MDLPSEIWEKIIVEIKDVKECIKLFKSFPKITQKYIRNIFDNHIQAIKVKILYCYQNCLFLAIENKNIMIMKYSDIFNDIKYVKYMSGGCIVAADKKGKINFWDFKTRKYLDCIEIDSELQNIEFHPTESRMIVSLIREDLGIEFQSIFLKKDGINFNQILLAHELDFLIEIVYHPTLPYVLLIRYRNYQIYAVYLFYNYDDLLLYI